MQKVFFKTFGCRTNIYDTQIMMENLRDFKLAKDEKDADIIVVNSCTVTNSADATARNYISKVSKLNKKVIFAGCGAISRGKELFEKGRVYGVFGHSEKENINSLLKNEGRFYDIGDLKSVEKSIVYDFEGKNRAFIKIQEGCDFRCSYCIIPFVRGNARSQDEDKILKQVEILASNGYGEFILTGTNIGSYGKDKGTSLGKLLKNISKIRGVKRIRLGSIEPVQIDDDFMEIVDEEWLERHLHIALQHTNKEMLRLMRRRNIYEKDKELLWRLSQKGFALGTDFIVGHPGETKERFEDGYEKLKELPLTHIHCFTYSKRDNTHSLTLKDEIRGDVAKKRHKRVVDLIAKKNYNFRKDKNDPLLILIEEKKGGYFIGYDQYYNKIFIKSDKDIDKKWVEIKDYEVKEDANYAIF
ncbi:MAG: tRNA (N(6)-L-threonylcarbamoyladenosine(37)-C(2))-methylthiotransferase MtaB [Epsilonproteobacteria bacterium]|nr:tRNA (N(6)-L-threonylcarbamoyladenosine(37)-C(2))-methylthiotransferase MtaB [Campylobacterota bacterium]